MQFCRKVLMHIFSSWLHECTAKFSLILELLGCDVHLHNVILQKVRQVVEMHILQDLINGISTSMLVRYFRDLCSESSASQIEPLLLQLHKTILGREEELLKTPALSNSLLLFLYNSALLRIPVNKIFYTWARKIAAAEKTGTATKIKISPPLLVFLSRTLVANRCGDKDVWHAVLNLTLAADPRVSSHSFPEALRKKFLSSASSFSQSLQNTGANSTESVSSLARVSRPYRKSYYERFSDAPSLTSSSYSPPSSTDASSCSSTFYRTSTISDFSNSIAFAPTSPSFHVACFAGHAEDSKTRPPSVIAAKAEYAAVTDKGTSAKIIDKASSDFAQGNQKTPDKILADKVAHTPKIADESARRKSKADEAASERVSSAAVNAIVGAEGANAEAEVAAAVEAAAAEGVCEEDDARWLSNAMRTFCGAADFATPKHPAMDLIFERAAAAAVRPETRVHKQIFYNRSERESRRLLHFLWALCVYKFHLKTLFSSIFNASASHGRLAHAAQGLLSFQSPAFIPFQLAEAIMFGKKENGEKISDFLSLLSRELLEDFLCCVKPSCATWAAHFLSPHPFFLKDVQAFLDKKNVKNTFINKRGVSFLHILSDTSMSVNITPECNPTALVLVDFARQPKGLDKDNYLKICMGGHFMHNQLLKRLGWKVELLFQSAWTGLTNAEKDALALRLLEKLSS